MNWQDHISIDLGILVGKPVVKGTRIAVELILADEDVPGPAVTALRACGHDVLWAKKDMPGRRISRSSPRQSETAGWS